jgi:hypothetical protein
MSEKLQDQYESYKDMVLGEYQKGNVVFMGIEGAMIAPIDKFIEQPTDGILYDLNRDEVVTLTMIKNQKWVNDYAVAKVIRALKRQLEQAEAKIKAYEEMIKIIPCTCNIAYTSRKLTAPDCPRCNYIYDLEVKK